jgi:glutamate-1-semialdehyde 2,1-aminomutase
MFLQGDRIMTAHYSDAELRAKARAVLPAGHFGNVGNGVVIAEGEGGRVRDTGGKEYVDFLLGSGPMLVGHRHPHVMQAVQEQLARGTTFFANSEPGILLAEAIVNAMACAEQVRYTSTGSEATLYAMRAVRAHRRRSRILKFEGGYHGMNDYALMSLAPKRRSNSSEPIPDSAGIPTAVRDQMLVAPYNDLEAVTALVEVHHDELAGIIVEPFQRIIAPQPGFLQGLRDLTRRYDIPLIFDETVTGFRFAYGGAQEYYGVTPDLCTVGKVVGGGFPLAAVAGSRAIMAHFDPDAVAAEDFLPQIGTLSGNPVAASAGLATLEVLQEDGSYERLFETGRTLMHGLRGILDDAGITAQICGEGCLFDVVFTDQPIVDYWSTQSGDAERAKRFGAALLEHGVLRGGSKFYVSTAHTPEDVEHTLHAFQAAARAL